MRQSLALSFAALLLFAACGGAASGEPAPTPSASALTSVGSSAVPMASGMPTVPSTPEARASLPPAPILQPPAFASRVVVADLGIDLPVISGDLQPPPNYPLCDVAAYVTRFSQPYEAGVTYISAHAQAGMFLPLLEASRVDGGASLTGKRVEVYTNDGMRYGYRIERIRPHATDYALVGELDPSARTLILQTSEGPFGTTEKLQVLAVAVDEAAVPVEEATPEPMPRDCRPPELLGEEPASPTTEPSASPIVVTAPTPPVGSPPPAPSAPPAASPEPGSSPQGLVEGSFASRVVVPEMAIDLPVVSGDLRPPPNYPYCDVAAYVTFLAQPDEPGTTYITAHAQDGMFLPILEASERDDGREMLGMTADVYTTDALRYRYEIWQVQRHITDRGIATEGLAPDERRLILQTSEGPYGTPDKLAIAARLVSIERVDRATAMPQAEPRDCTPSGQPSDD